MATSVRFSKETVQHLDSLAARFSRSRTQVIRDLVDCGFDELEQKYLPETDLSNIVQARKQGALE
jgi:predicted DNA-binding protein